MYLAFLYLFVRWKASLDVYRRRTVKEMALKNGRPDTGLNKRLGMSLPNLGEETHLSILKHMSPTNIIPETRKRNTLCSSVWKK